MAGVTVLEFEVSDELEEGRKGRKRVEGGKERGEREGSKAKKSVRERDRKNERKRV